MSSIITQLFTERFRPKDLSTLIIPPRIRNELSKGLVQNVLLYSGPGTGKSSAGHILSKPYTTLYINFSSERGIDTIREKISKFCATISLDGGKETLKCVFLDEFDGGTDEAFKALRGVIEKFSNITRFIATANYIQKIPDAIQSRFNCISFDPINSEEEKYLFEEYKKRVILILNAIKITYTDETLEKFIQNDFPDMRSLLNKIQSFYLQGIKELNDKNFNINYDFEDLYRLCLNKPDKPYDNYKFVVGEFSNRVDEAIISLGNDFIEYIKSNAPDKIDKIPLIIIAAAEYQYQVQFVVDKFVTLLALIFKIQLILHEKNI